MEKLQARYDSLSESQQGQKEKSAHLEEQCRLLEGQKEELEQKNLLAETVLDSLKAENRQNEEENRSLLQTIEESRDEKRKLQEETERSRNEIRLLQKTLDEMAGERENLYMEQEKMNERLEDLNRRFNPAIRKEVEQKLKKAKDKATFLAKQMNGIWEVAGIIAPHMEFDGDFGDMDRIRQALSEIDQRIDALANGIRLYEKNIEESLS